jgi:hypothetical protein
MKIRELFGDVYKPNGRTMTDTESFLLNQMVEVENPMLVDTFTSRLEFSAPSMVSPITGYAPEPRQLLVTRLDGENVSRIVTPGEITREFGSRHEFDADYTHAFEMIELANCGRKCSRLAITGIFSEGANMHLINDKFVPGWQFEGIVLPVKMRICHDGVTPRMKPR